MGLVALGGLAVVTQIRMMLSYADHAIPKPEDLERLAISSGSQITKKTTEPPKDTKDCSECLKKPQAPEWWNEEEKK